MQDFFRRFLILAGDATNSKAVALIATVLRTEVDGAEIQVVRADIRLSSSATEVATCALIVQDTTPTIAVDTGTDKVERFGHYRRISIGCADTVDSAD